MKLGWLSTIVLVVVGLAAAPRVAAAKGACASPQACMAACAAKPEVATCARVVELLGENLDVDGFQPLNGKPWWITSLASEAQRKLTPLCTAAQPAACVALATVKIASREDARDDAQLACDARQGAGCRLLGDNYLSLKQSADALLAFDRGCKLKDAASCAKAASVRWASEGERAEAQRTLERACAKGAKAVRLVACTLLAERAETAPGPLTIKACALGSPRACDRLAQVSATPAGRADAYAPGCAAGSARVCRWQATALIGASNVPAARQARQRGCDLGELVACVDLASGLANATDGTADPKRAARLRERACAGGIVDACVARQLTELGTTAKPAPAAQRTKALAKLESYCLTKPTPAAACSAVLEARLATPAALDAAAVARARPLVAALCAIYAEGCDTHRDTLDAAAARLGCAAGDQAACATHGATLSRTDLAAATPVLDGACKAGQADACANLTTARARQGDATARAEIVARCQRDDVDACGALDQHLAPTSAERRDLAERVCRLRDDLDACAAYAEALDGDPAVPAEQLRTAFQRACDLDNAAYEDDWGYGDFDSEVCARLTELDQARDAKRAAEEAEAARLAAELEAETAAAHGPEVATVEPTPAPVPETPPSLAPERGRRGGWPSWLARRYELAVAQSTLTSAPGGATTEGRSGSLGLGLGTHRRLLGQYDSIARLGLTLEAHAEGGRDDADRWTHDLGASAGAWLDAGMLRLGVAGVIGHAGWAAAAGELASPLPGAREQGVAYALTLGQGAWTLAGELRSTTRRLDAGEVTRDGWRVELQRHRYGGAPIALALEHDEVPGLEWYGLRLRVGPRPLP